MPDPIKELEAQAAVHRAGLAAAVTGLTSGAPQPGAMLGGMGLGNVGGELAQDLGKAALSTAKRNPLGAALVGVGLVMLLNSSQKPKASADPAPDTNPTPQRNPNRDRAEQKPAPVSAEAQRLSLHEGLGHLPPEARKRVIRKRIAAMEAQQEVENRPTDPVGILRKHPLAVLLAVAGIGAAAATLWPAKGLKAQKKRDQAARAAEVQLGVEESRYTPFPDVPARQAPARDDFLQDRI